MSITRERSTPDSSNHVGADMFTRVDSYPYLGVTISPDRIWHNHISTSPPVSALYGVMSTTAHLKSNHLLTHHLSDLTQAQLEYAWTAWDPYLVGDTQQLEKVQRRAARFVFRDYKYTLLLLLVYWSASNDHYTVHQSYKLQTRIVLQSSTRPGWYPSSSSSETTAKHQISRRHNIRRIFSSQEPISFRIFPRTIVDWN